MKPARWPAWAWGPAFAGALGLLVVACVSDRAELPSAPIAHGDSIAVQTAPVVLDPSDLGRAAVGDFRYAGGIALTSNQTSRLHGLSDLSISPENRITSVSDDGADLLTARLILDPAGRLVGIADVVLKPLHGLDDRPFQDKAMSDAEGLTLIADGEMLVSFEREHRILRYPAAGAPSPVPMPSIAMAENDGMEGLTAARAVAPDAYWVGVEPGGIWLCRLSAACQEVQGLPRPPPGFRLSSLTTGPGGELVILHHSWFPTIGSRIQVHIVRDPTGAKQVIGGFAMTPSTTVDNYEGIAVTAGLNGDWRLYLLSDDNFNAAQRTLLLAFDWTPPK